jgi:subtilisin family serine protease
VNRPRAGALVAALAAALLLGGLAVPAAAAGASPQRTWHADQARVPDARAVGREGEGVLVAVLDTWVDAAHGDFEGRVVTGADCTGGSCREGVPAPDPCTHGTHVAGTVASSSYGVATKASVLPVKVLAYAPARPGSPASCSGTVSGVAAGIRYATSKGAQVINLSLGTLVPGLSQSSAIDAAVAEAGRAGALVVFAAGNSTVPVTDTYGGNALIVAATGPEGRLALYSQRGSGVSLAAPGGDPPTLDDCSPERCVTSLFPNGKYAVAAGTSMAAPHVAGVAALLLAQEPGRGRQSVVERLRSTARPVPGGGAGAGLVDATAALGAPSSGPPPGGSPAPPPEQAPPPGPVEQAPPDGEPAPGLPAAEGVAPPAPLGADGVPVEPEPPPEAEPAAPEQPQVAGDTDSAVATGPDEALPPGPPALAVALLLTAALSTTLAGLRRRPPSAA